MKKLIVAAALSVALPAIAHAQVAPAPKMDCCEKMKAEGKKCGCCKEKMGGHDAHAGHSDMQPAPSQPQPDQHNDRH